MSKAKIIIAYKGDNYRVGKRTACASKRDCDLFERGVCDSERDVKRMPCDAIADAFIEVCGTCPNFGFKKIRNGK